VGNKNSLQICPRSCHQITNTKEVISSQRPQLSDQHRLAEGRHASETYSSSSTTHHTTPASNRTQRYPEARNAVLQGRFFIIIIASHRQLQCGYSMEACNLKCAINVITCNGTQTPLQRYDSVLWRQGEGSGLTLCKAPVVTICTASLTVNNSTFFPHSVFMCFVWIWEQTAIISLYSINYLRFLMATDCDLCSV
jgi:hypothetical protein